MKTITTSKARQALQALSPVRVMDPRLLKRMVRKASQKAVTVAQHNHVLYGYHVAKSQRRHRKLRFGLTNLRDYTTTTNAIGIKGLEMFVSSTHVHLDCERHLRHWEVRDIPYTKVSTALPERLPLGEIGALLGQEV